MLDINFSPFPVLESDRLLLRCIRLEDAPQLFLLRSDPKIMQWLDREPFTSIEEATALEMPMLEQNLTIIATLVSIGTLTGLLGTVFGMINAFHELAAAGATNQTALSASISEALVNTALGISTSAISIIMYNIFTSKIDKLTYAIDETGFSIVQTFGTHSK